MNEQDFVRREDRRKNTNETFEGEERRSSRKDRRSQRNLKLVTFYVENDLYGIDISKVQEIIIDQDVFSVPLADSAVSGLSNLRGQVLSVFDIRNALGYKPSAEKKISVGIVIQTDEQPVIFKVDRQGDYLEISDTYFYSAPQTISPMLQESLSGICRLTDQQLLMVLDSDKVVSM